MNKRGQLFTILAIFLIILMFASFELFSFFQGGKSIRTRVSTMDAFLSSLETNLGRQVNMAGHRIIFLAENRIRSTGNYINNFENFYSEAFFNGTINGVNETSIMPGATYSDLIDSINTKASKINVEIMLNNSFFNITQSDPWYVNVSLISNFVMVDKEDLARWEKIQTVSATIPIVYFLDPVLLVSQNAVNFNRSTYVANSSSPSFLMMLEGNLGPDANGISRN